MVPRSSNRLPDGDVHLSDVLIFIRQTIGILLLAKKDAQPNICNDIDERVSSLQKLLKKLEEPSPGDAVEGGAESIFPGTVATQTPHS